jgi:hypothetical protein
LTLPKSRRGLLLNLSNTSNPDGASGINPPSIITDSEGNRLKGRDLQRTKFNDNELETHLSPTHDSGALRSTLENSHAKYIRSNTTRRSFSIDTANAAPDGTATRDFVTSLQSNACGVARTSRIFSATHSQNDRIYKLKPSTAVGSSLELSAPGNKPFETARPSRSGGENRVIFSAHGRWSTFFSEEDLRKPPKIIPSTEPIDTPVKNDETLLGSPTSRTSFTFQSDNMRQTMNWRSANGQSRRAKKFYPHLHESSQSTQNFR